MRGELESESQASKTAESSSNWVLVRNATGLSVLESISLLLGLWYFIAIEGVSLSSSVSKLRFFSALDKVEQVP